MGKMSGFLHPRGWLLVRVTVLPPLQVYTHILCARKNGIPICRASMCLLVARAAWNNSKRSMAGMSFILIKRRGIANRYTWILALIDTHTHTHTISPHSRAPTHSMWRRKNDGKKGANGHKFWSISYVAQHVMGQSQTISAFTWKYARRAYSNEIMEQHAPNYSPLSFQWQMVRIHSSERMRHMKWESCLCT